MAAKELEKIDHDFTAEAVRYARDPENYPSRAERWAQKLEQYPKKKKRKPRGGK